LILEEETRHPRKVERVEEREITRNLKSQESKRHTWKMSKNGRRNHNNSNKSTQLANSDTARKEENNKIMRRNHSDSYMLRIPSVLTVHKFEC
jgi:outer membrane receptor for ferrienterochelin and colicin